MAPNDFDIDEFKESWQKENRVSRYQDDDILDILNRKSRSYVQLIAWISVAELLFFALFYLWSWFQEDSAGAYLKLFAKMGLNSESAKQLLESSYGIFELIGVLISLIFIWIFFKKFRAIKVESSAKNLIEQIISFRKSVHLYIWLNVVFFVVYITFIGLLPLYFEFYQGAVLKTHTYQNFLISMGVAAFVGLVILVIYYKLVYGILVGKLSKNLSQLKALEKIEEKQP